MHVDCRVARRGVGWREKGLALVFGTSSIVRFRIASSLGPRREILRCQVRLGDVLDQQQNRKGTDEKLDTEREREREREMKRRL